MSEGAQVENVLRTLENWKASTQYMCNLAPADFAMQDCRPYVARSINYREKILKIIVYDYISLNLNTSVK